MSDVSDDDPNGTDPPDGCDDDLLDGEPDEWVKKNAAAEIVEVDESTIRAWVKSGTIEGRKLTDGSGKTELFVSITECYEAKALTPKAKFKRVTSTGKSPVAGAAACGCKHNKEDAKVAFLRQTHRFNNQLMEPNRHSMNHMMQLITECQQQARYWENRCRERDDIYEQAMSREHERKLQLEEREYQRKKDAEHEAQAKTILTEGIAVMKTVLPAIIGKVTGSTAPGLAVIADALAGLTDPQIQALINSGIVDQKTLIAIIELRDQIRKQKQDGKAKEESKESAPKNGASDANGAGANGQRAKPTEPPPGAN